MASNLETTPLEKRKKVSEGILKRYSDRVPVILKKYKPSDPDCEKCKYLVPDNLTIGKFMYEIRKNVKVTPEQSIFLYIDNIHPPTSELVSNLYSKYKNEDGFLYIIYTSENTFGAFI